MHDSDFVVLNNESFNLIPSFRWYYHPALGKHGNLIFFIAVKDSGTLTLVNENGWNDFFCP